jgi:hypothetical protein
MLGLCRWLGVGACFLAAAGLFSQGNEFKYIPDQIGAIETIRVAPGANENWKLSPAELKLFTGHLAALRDLMLSQPVFNPPKGFLVSGNMRVADQGGRTGIPIRGWGYLRYHPYAIVSNSGKSGPIALENNSPELYLYVNDPTAALGRFSGGPYFPFDETPVLFEPHRIGEQQGFAIYTKKLGDEVSPFIILTRSTKPIWVPLSKESFLQILIKHHEARHAAGDGDYRTVEPIDNMRAALAKMSTEERREQAVYMEHYDYSPPLATRGTQEAQPLVVPNPELFDPAIPRTAIQLVTAEFRASWNLKDPAPDRWGNHIRLRHAETLTTSDWKMISALLDQR